MATVKDVMFGNENAEVMLAIHSHVPNLTERDSKSGRGSGFTDGGSPKISREPRLGNQRSREVNVENLSTPR